MGNEACCVSRPEMELLNRIEGNNFLLIDNFLELLCPVDLDIGPATFHIVKAELPATTKLPGVMDSSEFMLVNMTLTGTVKMHKIVPTPQCMSTIQRKSDAAASSSGAHELP